MAALQSWLVSVLAWFCDVLDAMPATWRDTPLIRNFIAASKASIARSLRVNAFNLRRIVFWHALARLNAIPESASNQRISPPPPGARRARRTASLMRTFTHMLAGTHAGSLRQRVARLDNAVRNFNNLVEQAVKRLRAVLRNAQPPALVAVFARVAQLAASPARARFITDTS